MAGTYYSFELSRYKYNKKIPNKFLKALIKATVDACLIYGRIIVFYVQASRTAFTLYLPLIISIIIK